MCKPCSNKPSQLDFPLANMGRRISLIRPPILHLALLLSGSAAFHANHCPFYGTKPLLLDSTGTWRRSIESIGDDSHNGARLCLSEDGRLLHKFHPQKRSVRLDGSVVSTHDNTTHREPPVPTTLREALNVFFLDQYNGPRLIVAILCGLATCRTFMSEVPVTTMDAVVASLAIVFWWFQEHFLHKYLLHSKLDWYGKEIHEGHHSKPYFHISIDPGRCRPNGASIQIIVVTMDDATTVCMNGLLRRQSHAIVSY